MTGRIYGIGLGPGDPDLMSVKAHRLLSLARHVAYFRKQGRAGRARTMVNGLLPEAAQEVAMEYPVTTEVPVSDPRYNEMLSGFYSDCTTRLTDITARGEDVVVLCEGDPFFYGSFMHLYERLKDNTAVEVVPGITGMSAAWTASGAPITWGDDVLTVLMGTLSEADLTRHMGDSDALVIMKVGRNFKKICDVLKVSGKYDAAWLVEYAAMDGQTVQRLSDVSPDHKAPYFSIILVHGQGRRP
ncbi:MAG: precorrin-2 C(20)-methyltransferase [Silicimonas sp.]|nr:precorrin-2 C(20)-methyltransferase [Silicimonas sp.]